MCSRATTSRFGNWSPSSLPIPRFPLRFYRVANSPLFGFRSQIDSVQSALVVLGLRRVRALTMTVATANHMKAVLKIEELSRCWRHMLACALLTEELARSCSKFEERANTAGVTARRGPVGLRCWPILPNAASSCAMPHAMRWSCWIVKNRRWVWITARPAAFWRRSGVSRRSYRSSPHAITIRKPITSWTCSRWYTSAAGWPTAWDSGWSEPLKPCTAEEIQGALPPLLKSRIHIDADRWREILERRIRCYGNPEATSPTPPVRRPSGR